MVIALLVSVNAFAQDYIFFIWSWELGIPKLGRFSFPKMDLRCHIIIRMVLRLFPIYKHMKKKLPDIGIFR